MTNAVEFIDPWMEIIEYSENVAQEAYREISVGHALYGVRLVPLAQYRYSDDVLFRLEGHAKPFAVIHMTWSGHPESDTHYPETTLFDSLEDWFNRRMLPDVREAGDPMSSGREE